MSFLLSRFVLSSFARRATSLVIFFAAIATPAWGIPLNLNLPLIAFDATATNRLNITVESEGFSDSDRTRLTGNVLSTIDYDIVNSLPRVNTIQFTGGTINVLGQTTDNIELALGNFFAGVDITGIEIKGRLTTPQPPSLVLSSGNFPTQDHALRLFQGILDVDGKGLLSSVDETVNLASDPIELTQAGTGSILVQPGSVNGLSRTFQATITLPVDAEDTVEVSDDITATVTALGNIVARTNFTIFFPLEGDYNRDGIVNAADYAVWRDSLGATGAGLAADGNFDLAVNTADYNLWKENFGDEAPGSGGGTALVPEPTSLALGGGLFALLFINGRLRRESGREHAPPIG